MCRQMEECGLMTRKKKIAQICMFLSCVYPVAVLNSAFCMTYSLLMLVEDVRGTPMEEAYSSAGLIIIRAREATWLNHFATVLFNVCSAVTV